MKNFSDWDLLRLAESLTVAEAACCIIGLPTTVLGVNHATAPYLDSNRLEGLAFNEPNAEINSYNQFELVLGALERSIRSEKLKAHIVTKIEYEYRVDTDNSVPIGESINLWETLIDVVDIKRWLEEKHLLPEFFFGEHSDKPDYLDPSNPRYAPKLAAAVCAWQAVVSPGLSSPKKALEKWLRENAARFGLVDDEGNPVGQAVEDCSKVANWNQSGGAPKTPAL